MEEKRGDEGEERERQTMTASLLKKQIVCLSGALFRAHKQVGTNNILAALRGVDGEPSGFDVCSWGGSLFLSFSLFSRGCPRATVTRRTSAARSVINAGLGPTHHIFPFARFHDLTHIFQPNKTGLQPNRRRISRKLTRTFNG